MVFQENFRADFFVPLETLKIPEKTRAAGR